MMPGMGGLSNKPKTQQQPARASYTSNTMGLHGVGGGGETVGLHSGQQAKPAQPAKPGTGMQPNSSTMPGSSGSGGATYKMSAAPTMSKNPVTGQWNTWDMQHGTQPVNQNQGILDGLEGGGWPGGGPGGTGPELNFHAQENPLMKGVFDQTQKYKDELGANNDIESTNAMSRQRDLFSGMNQELGENTSFRMGVGGGAGAQVMGRTANAQGAQLAGLNANLASEGRRRQGDALNSLGGQAQGIAGQQLAQNRQLLDQWQAGQGAQNAQQQLALQRRRLAYDQYMGLINSPIFSGF